MHALEAANELLGAAILEHSNQSHERGDRLTRQAQAYAAIAQAEQLQRIADLLQHSIAPYGLESVDPELIDYRKNAHPGESIHEYRLRIAA